MELHRREFAALLIGAAAGLATGAPAGAQDDPLPSWNAGAAKDAILKFVRDTTDRAGPHFVPPAERIASFDQDGTLWVKHPLYTQAVFCLDRVPALVAQKPELKERPPFKSVGEHRPMLTRNPKLVLDNLGAGKIENFWLMYGRRPHAAFGNSSDDDQQMLEYVKAGGEARLSAAVLHDDAAREYAYGPSTGLPATSVGTFSQEMYDLAVRQHWAIISMKRDWRRIFPFEG